MAELKTRQNDRDVEAFLAEVEDDARREDCRRVMEVMAEETGEPARMWGDSIIGFGSYHYVYDSGREGDWFLTGVSPRKRNLSVYILPGLDPHADLLERLGPHQTGKSCLYLRSLETVDLRVLRELVRRSITDLRSRYG